MLQTPDARKERKERESKEKKEKNDENISIFLSSLFLCIQCDTTEFYNHSNNFLYARIVETMYDKYLG